jgi:hypothetical protein
MVGWVFLVGILCDGTRHDTRATGFLVGDGLVATALHAVTGSEPDDVPLSVTVVTADGRRFKIGEIEAMDPARDVALLRLPGRSEWWLRPAESIATGSPVRVMGNPLRRDHPVLAATVAGVRLDELGNLRYRIDQPLRRRSGAPVLDGRGRFVGLVSTTHEVIPAEAVMRLLEHRSPVSLREAHEALGRSPQGLLDFAQDAYRRGNLARTMQLLESAVALEPQLAAAHNMLGVLLRRKGRYEEALEHYERAIHILPSYSPAYRNLGLLRERLAIVTLATARLSSARRTTGSGRTTPSPPVSGLSSAGVVPLPVATAAALGRIAPVAPGPGDDLVRLRAAATFVAALGVPALLLLFLRRLRRR